MDFYEIMLQQKLAKGSGGGSSDFSTAEVTIVNASQESLDVVLLPIISDSEQFTGVMGALPARLLSEDSRVVPVPLYKGECLWITLLYEPYANFTFSGSGNVTVMPAGLRITGDCTITIS